jgi:hypothetical protein
LRDQPAIISNTNNSVDFWCLAFKAYRASRTDYGKHAVAVRGTLQLANAVLSAMVSVPLT